MTDRYTKSNSLGVDILGSVYLAEDTMLQRRVVLRQIEYGEGKDKGSRDDEWRKDFAKRAGMLGAMQHPNMVTVYDINLDDNGANIVSQLVEGQTLAERLAEGPLAQLGVYRMASDMLEVLHAAHDSEVFHGALHTGSITRVDRASGGHRYLLMDLGLNQLASMVRGEKVKVADPVLMAPELHEVGHDATAKSDLFMLGQLCYTALVGGHPFSEKSSEECQEAYQTEGIPHLESYVQGVDPDFASWVMSLVEVDPEKRPKDTSAAMVTLHTIKLDEPAPNVPGETQAIPAYSGDPAATAAQLVTAAQVVAAGGVDGTITGAQTQNSQPGILAQREKKEKMVMNVVIGGLVAVLVIAGLVLGLRGGDEDKGATESAVNEIPTTSEIAKSSGEGELSTISQGEVSIGDEVLINSVEEQETPESINLNGRNMVDWFVGSEIPIGSNSTQKSDGDYLIRVEPIDSAEEFSMENNPIRFKAGGQDYLPRAAILGDKKSGYDVKISIPSEKAQSILVNLYLVQKSCDLLVDVEGPNPSSGGSKQISYVKQGVISVPVEITSPTPGSDYTIRIEATSTSRLGQHMVGVSGVVIDAF